MFFYKQLLYKIFPKIKQPQYWPCRLSGDKATNIDSFDKNDIKINNFNIIFSWKYKQPEYWPNT